MDTLCLNCQRLWLYSSSLVSLPCGVQVTRNFMAPSVLQVPVSLNHLHIWTLFSSKSFKTCSRGTFSSAEVHVIMVCSLKASFAGYKVLGSHFAEYFQYYFLFIAVSGFTRLCLVFTLSQYSHVQM